VLRHRAGCPAVRECRSTSHPRHLSAQAASVASTEIAFRQSLDAAGCATSARFAPSRRCWRRGESPHIRPAVHVSRRPQRRSPAACWSCQGLTPTRAPDLGKEQIEGLLEAVSAVRPYEEQELPHPSDDVGLMHGWHQVLFLQELPVAVERSVQVVGGARHNWPPLDISGVV
jgi:hypothetical protein